MGDATNKIYLCPVEVALDLIGGRWKSLILGHLRDGSLGLEELARRIPLATRRMLDRRLRQLEGDGLVERKEFVEVPPPIEYALTAAGSRLMPLLDQLAEVGREHARRENLLIDEFGEASEPGDPPLMHQTFGAS